MRSGFVVYFLYNMHERDELVERVYAFTDESGAFGWDIENPNVSTHFIITAIIVKESELESFTQQAEALRKKHFQTGEIKSNNIGSNHARRLRVLADLQGIQTANRHLNKQDAAALNILEENLDYAVGKSDQAQ